MGALGLCLTALLVLVGGCRQESGGPVSPKAAAKPNIVLISMESVRADHVGCYGYDRDTTPALDALAAEAIVFENAFAVTSWTLTSHASMFTGLYPTAHKVTEPLHRLHDSYTTAAELLREQGYQTAGLVAGPFLRRNHNLHQGFVLYDQSATSETNRLAHEDVTNPQIERLLRQYLLEDRSSTSPFFLFVYLWDPHYDYIPPSPYDAMFVPDGAEPFDLHNYELWEATADTVRPEQAAYVISQYDGEIRCTDALLGRLWQLLRDLQLWDQTAIIVTADHGEEFFEHGMKGHKNHLYNESLHVPLIVKPPGGNAPKRDRRLVSLVDLFPTMLAWADIQPTLPHHGRSLLASAPTGPTASFYELVTTFYFPQPSGEELKQFHQWYAIREGDFKLITVYDENAWALYDLATDPGEQSALGAEHADKLSELRTRLESYRRQMQALAKAWASSPPAELDSKELERLRSLGYLNPDG